MAGIRKETMPTLGEMIDEVKANLRNRRDKEKQETEEKIKFTAEMESQTDQLKKVKDALREVREQERVTEEAAAKIKTQCEKLISEKRDKDKLKSSIFKTR